MILKSKNFESKFGVVEGDNELLVKKRTKVPVKTDKESVDHIHTKILKVTKYTSLPNLLSDRNK